MRVQWNQDLRRILYRELFRKFGNVEQWNSFKNPTGDISDYKLFLEKMSLELSNSKYNYGKKYIAPSAIEAQLAWGLQKKQSKCSNKYYLSAYILNRALALEFKVISSNRLPKVSEFKY